jgi:hypothetical protein
MEALKEKFSNRSFKFKTQTKNAEAVEVAVVMPDLKRSKLSVWGCWGPMYKFNLGEDNTIKVVYDNQTFELDQKSIEFVSPVCADQRKQSPLYCQILDKERNCSFSIYLNSDASLKSLSVDPLLKNEWYQNFEESSVAKKASAFA